MQSRGPTSSKRAFFVGIESFVATDGETWCLDMAAIVICDAEMQILSFVTSSGVSFPMDAYVAARQVGFDTTTVGSKIAELHGGDGTDPHSTLTKGRLTRQETLIMGLVAALKQIDFESF